MIKRYVKGHEVLLSDEDANLFDSHSWYLLRARQHAEKYYLVTAINKKTIYLHRLIIGATQIIDHIDRNPLNCQRDNLREVTYAQNRINSEMKHNKTGPQTKNIYFKEWRHKPYQVLVGRVGAKSWLGSYETLDEAKQHLDIYEEIYADAVKPL